MKLNIKNVIPMIMCSILLTGCSFQNQDTNDKNVEKVPQEKEEAEKEDVSSYNYQDNSEFKVVHYEVIDDGTFNGLQISIVVHKETKVMYKQTTKFNSGYGLSSELMVDADGSPLLYDGEL